MNAVLRAELIEMVADADSTKRWHGLWLEVVDPSKPVVQPRWQNCLPNFRTMRDAITSDIASAQGAGADFIEGIRRIEAGEVDKIEADGNAWVAHITKDKVWFEGLYSQGEGGEVSFAQYKLAVQTYVRFLADPQHRTIEVPFPSD